LNAIITKFPDASGNMTKHHRLIMDTASFNLTDVAIK